MDRPWPANDCNKSTTFASAARRFGELVQWDSSTHDWLEGRDAPLKRIRMIDDATSHSRLRFAEHDTVEENFRLLERWLKKLDGCWAAPWTSPPCS
jgi:hypothetical protein